MDALDRPQADISTSEILRDVLARKMNRNPSFSLRAFARDLGVSHTYLSLVLNGKKALSMKKVIHFSQLLEFDDREADLFMKAGTREAKGRAFEKAGTEPAKSRRKKPGDLEKYFELEIDNFRVLNDWYHIPILELTCTQDFRSDLKWIAQRLSISVEQVRNAVERLKRLNLLAERDGRLVKTNESLSIMPKKFEKAIRDYHRQMLAKASDIMELGSPEGYAARDVTGSCMAIDPKLLPEARKKIAAFRRSLIKFLSSGEGSEVYQLGVQLFPVTTPQPKSKGVVVKRGVK